MAFSKVKVGGLADDSVTAANIDDDGTGYTVGDLTNSGTLQQTGQATFGSGGTNWTLPTSRGTDKYVLQINGTTGAADWAESLTAPEISGHNFDVSGSTDDGGINQYEAPYEYTGTTNQTTTISALSSTTGLLAGQYISGAGIPADTTIVSVDSGASTMVISNAVTVAGTQTGVALKIQKTPGEKNGGKVTLTGANFGATIGEISVAITNSAGAVIANASYLSGLSNGTSITAEWTGTEGSYSTDLTSSYTDPIYFKMTKSGLSSNVHNTNTTLTADPAVTTLTISSQTGGDRSPLFTTTDAPSASSLGGYGTERIAGGGQDSNTKLLLNFDRGGGTDIEESSNTGGDGHKVTANGNAIIKASPFGDGKTAMFFNGSSDILRVASSADFGLGSGAFTVEGWAYKASATNTSGIIFSTRTNSSGWSTEWQLRMHSNGYFTWFPNGGGSGTEKVFSNFSYAVNTWYHFALVRDSNNTIELFIDGVSRGTHTDSTNYNLAKELQIGAQYTSSSDNWFNGYLDDLRIVKGTAVYTGDFDVPTSRLTAITNTKLLIHSNQVKDSSSNAYNITYVGSAYDKTDTTNRSNSGAHANFGSSAMQFGSTSTTNTDYIYVPYGSDVDNLKGGNTQSFTVEFQIKFGSTSNVYFMGPQNIVSTNNDNRTWALGINDSGGSFRWLSSTNNSSGWTLDQKWSTGGLSTNTWYHVAIVYDASGSNGSLKCYLNGTALSVSGTDNTGLAKSNYAIRSFSSSDYRYAFGSHVGYYFNGLMDEIRISDTARYSGSSFTVSTTPFTSDSNTLLLLHGDGGKFTDSATSGTTHTITPTGAFHSTGHGGIAPAMTWPANLKKTGSAGAYFGGTSSDKLSITPLAAMNDFGSGAFTLECWMYPTDVSINYQRVFQFQNTSQTDDEMHIGIHQGNLIYYLGGQGWVTTSHAVSNNVWQHFAMVRASTSANETRVYLNGKYMFKFTDNSNYSGNTAANIEIGNTFKGYIDSVRWSNVQRYHDEQTSGDWSNYLGTSGTTAWNQPTRIHGAFGPETPDVGTITLTATGDGDFTWSEVAGGTALPGTLAVGSTTHSGSGNSRTHTATITGTLPANTSTAYTNGVRGDTATSNILLKVQHDTDATKAVTLNGTTGMGITQKSTEKPVLFNSRRYVGNASASRDITGLGFKADLIWTKNRDATNWHAITDTLRGVGPVLYTNDTSGNDVPGTNNRILSVNSDGYTIGSNSSFNNNNNAYIAWSWKAGGAPSATGKSAKIQNGISSEDTISTTFNTGTDSYNTASGHVTSVTRSVNVDGGFSIIKYVNNGTGANRAIPHGLGSKPDMIMIKPLTSGTSWLVFHQELTSNDDLNAEFLRLNSSDAEVALPGSTSAATDYHFYTPNDNAYDLNTTNSAGVIAYCWKDVPNVSKFGSYVGAGSSGKTVTVGFKPKFLIIKRYNSTGSWSMWDTFRSPTGDDMKPLYANGDSVEGSADSTFTPTLTNTGFSFDSNVTHASLNGASQNYIYFAWA